MKKKTPPLRKLKLWVKQRIGWLGKPVIIPYTGYGNQNIIFFIGCVSEDKAMAKPKPTHTRWQNFTSMVRRFTADPLPGIRVQATFLGLQDISSTDEWGIFRFAISLRNRDLIIPEENWINIKLEFVDLPNEDEVSGKVLLTNPDKSSYGIISDIDDTILVSKSTQFIRKFRLMLFKNAYTRLPFEGVAGFYRALNKGANGRSYNPIFYVSNSQWNLYDLLTDFCRYREIPDGVMLLQELRPFKPKRLVKKRRAISRRPHKIDKIRSIFSTYDFLKFVLIGDSGQKDAEVYRQIAEEFPGRVLAIYIRDVRKSREKRVLWIGNSLKITNVDMLMIKDTVFAARHASNIGLISPAAIEEISNEKILDHHATITV